MTYRVECDDCVFQAREESEALARTLRDLHLLYNDHDVECTEDEDA